jgi:hypothetical protein
MNNGLLEVSTSSGSLRLPRVKTLFGGEMWVIRPLSPSEVIACWDVPEKLGRLLDTEDDRIALMRGMFTPLKIRQAVLEEVNPMMTRLLKPENGKEAGKSKAPLVIKRGPVLNLTTPEEERAVFQDQSDPPMNLLIESLENLGVNPSEEKSRSGSSPEVGTGPVGATKDDKAPIKSEWWDKMLYLGLSNHARAGSWAKASRTIRPLVARHWRRLQLRKWIRFVNEKRKKLEEVSESDREAARECLSRLQATTFWEWKSGSRPMVWNFPPDQQITMRDGIMLWMKGRMDPYRVPQRLPKIQPICPR